MIVIKDLEFDWDLGNIEKIQERFTIEEVEAFFDQNLLVLEDSTHSDREKRFIATGIGPGNKAMFVCFTLRLDKIRVISVRFMKVKEAMKYEKFKKSF
jgi:uncharacterized DUF497 family protein